MRCLLPVLLLAGCLYPGHGPNGDDRCEVADLEPAPIPLIDPDNLTCQSFNGGSCNPECGPCSAGGIFPSWGRCDSSCRNLGAAACAQATQCRVARDFSRYYTNDANDFDGCFPLDMAVATRGRCHGLSAQECSEHHECAALYLAVPNNCATCAANQFEECIPANRIAGSCNAPTTCDIVAPACPTNTTPGVANGCYTGSCIPNQFCAIDLATAG